MKGFILPLVLSLLPVMAQATSTSNDQQQLQKYQPYAQFFGFADTRAYLKFSGQFNRLLDGSLQLDNSLTTTASVQKLLALPISRWSTQDTSQLQQHYQVNSQQVAANLGIAEARMKTLVTQYVRYNELQLALEQQKRPDDNNLKPQSRQQLALPNDVQQQWQQLPPQARLVLISLYAQQQGVNAWQEFQLTLNGQQQSYLFSPELGALPAPL